MSQIKEDLQNPLLLNFDNAVLLSGVNCLMSTKVITIDCVFSKLPFASLTRMECL